MCGLLVCLIVVVVFLAWGWWCRCCCRHGGAKDVCWKPRAISNGCCVQVVGVWCTEQMQVVCNWFRVVVAKFRIGCLVVWDLGELVPFVLCGQVVQWVEADSDTCPEMLVEVFERLEGGGSGLLVLRDGKHLQCVFSPSDFVSLGGLVEGVVGAEEYFEVVPR